MALIINSYKFITTFAYVSQNVNMKKGAASSHSSYPISQTLSDQVFHSLSKYFLENPHLLLAPYLLTLQANFYQTFQDHLYISY
ncbi:MAG: hypothetical protein E7306_14220 [Butyrivibrio sp.]|nr:hypothetical protein [Butyrivibrio sp.]